MKKGEGGRWRSGFTLVELLLAIFIFAIVISAVYGAFITMLEAVDTTESQADINNKARIALERMTMDLESVFLGEGGYLRGKKREDQGNNADTLDFTSSAHLVFSKKDLPAGLAEITYTTDLNPDTGLLQLYRLDVPFRPGITKEDSIQNKGFLLCDGLKSIRIIYFNREGTEEDDWERETATENGIAKQKNIPTMIEIELVFASSTDSSNTQVFKTAVAMPRTDETNS